MVYTIVIFISVIVGVYSFLSNPLIQTFIARSASEYLSERTGTRILIDRIHINVFGKLLVREVKAYDKQDSLLLNADKINVQLARLELTNSLVKVGSVELKNAEFNILKHKGDSLLNLVSIIRSLSGSKKEADTSSSGSVFQLHVNKLIVKDLDFRYADLNEKSDVKGIDWKDLGIIDLDVKAHSISLFNDSINASFERLAFKERSGFRLENMSGDVVVCSSQIFSEELSITTPFSDISLQLNMSYNGFSEFSDFVNRVKLNTRINRSKITFSDVAYFTDALIGFNNTFFVSGIMRGTVNNFRARTLDIAYDENIRFRGSLTMNGLPDIQETFIHLDIDELLVNRDELEGINLPGNNQLKVPQQLQAFGNIKVDGDFSGFLYDFVSNGDFQTDIGRFSTDLLLKTIGNTDSIVYSGNLRARSFDMGAFLNISEYFGTLDLDLDVNGGGLTAEEIYVDLDGTIDAMNFMGNVYNQLKINGGLTENKFSGALNVKDESINLDFDGLVDFSSRIPVFDFELAIDSVYLDKLNVQDPNDEYEYIISSNIKCNLVGIDLDDIQGWVEIDSTLLFRNDELFTMDAFRVEKSNDSSGLVEIDLKSDFIDLNSKGTFLFRDIVPAFMDYIWMFIPTVIDKVYPASVKAENQRIMINAHIKDSQEIFDLFMPSIHISENTYVNSKYNSVSDDFDLIVESPFVSISGIKWYDLLVSSHSVEDELLLQIINDSVIFKEASGPDDLSLGVDNFVFESRLRQDTAFFEYHWVSLLNNYNLGNQGGFVALENFPAFSFRFDSAMMIVNGQHWRLNRDNYGQIDSSSISLKDFDFLSHRQQFGVNGVVSVDPKDTLKLYFTDWSFDNFDVLMNADQLSIDGVINGNLELVDLYNSPNFLADLVVDDLIINEIDFGRAELDTRWDRVQEILQTRFDIIYHGNVSDYKILAVDGTYKPSQKEDNLDLDIALKNFNLKVLRPVTDGVLSGLKGIVGGNLKIDGSVSQPELTGNLNMRRTEMMVDYLNVRYTIGEDIVFKPGEIEIGNITVYDTTNNIAKVSGSIFHNHLSDFRLDLNLKPTNFITMNTNKYLNDIFYGTAILNGDVTISGPFNNILMDAQIQPTKGTELTIPISYDFEAYETDYIIFTDAIDSVTEFMEYNVDLTGFGMNLGIDANPDAGIAIILPQGLGEIEARGNGNVDIGITSAGDFSLNGEYNISDGTFFFTLQNLLNRRFNINKGSKIAWTGSPYDAVIDLTAVYRTKTSLKGLVPDLEESGMTSRVDVDCILRLKNQLFNPEIDFSIRLPYADESIKSTVFALLDTTNAAVMNQQMISLLVLNSFSYTGQTTANIGASSFNILTNQIGNWLSQISNDVDIGINYLPGDEITSQELEVALSTTLMNDRVIIDGNVGYVGDKGTSQNNASNIVGDVNVEVKLTEDGRFRAKAFNRSNVNSYRTSYSYKDIAPYTQGIGIFYTKEFDSWSELFGKKKTKN